MKDSQRVYRAIVDLCSTSDIVLLGETKVQEHNECLRMLGKVNRSRRRGTKMVVVACDALKKYNMSVIHRASLRFEDVMAVKSGIVGDSGGDGRVALRALVKGPWNSGTFFLYAVHWPSLIYHGNMLLKEEAAWTIVKDLQVPGEGRAVCIGDFNAEPHQLPFFRMRASRSHNFTLKHGVFYNPFWRYLSEDHGTIRHTNKLEYQCFNPLIDQALVSKALLKDCEKTVAKIVDDIYDPDLNEHKPIQLCLTMKG